MKGLVYRDILINKKSLLLAIIFMVYLFKVITDQEVSNDEQVLMINLYTFIAVIFIYAIAEYVFKPDKVSKWERFLYATPISKKTLVGEKYLFDYIFISIGIVLSVILIFSYNVNLNNDMTYNEYLGIIYAVIIILTNSAIHKLLVFKFGEKSASIFSILFVIIFITLGIVALLLNKTNWLVDISLNTDYLVKFFLSKKMIFVMVISVILHGISYFISERVYDTHFD